MRVWLSLVVALIVALSAAAVAYVFLERFEEAFRARSQELAAGHTVQAAIAIAQADADGAPLDGIVGEAAFAPLFVFDADGDLLTPPRSQGVALSSVPNLDRALTSALGGRRFVETTDETGTVVGLPIATGGARAVKGSCPRKASTSCQARGPR